MINNKPSKMYLSWKKWMGKFLSCLLILVIGAKTISNGRIIIKGFPNNHWSQITSNGRILIIFLCSMLNYNDIHSTDELYKKNCIVLNRNGKKNVWWVSIYIYIFFRLYFHCQIKNIWNKNAHNSRCIKEK